LFFLSLSLSHSFQKEQEKKKSEKKQKGKKNKFVRFFYPCVFALVRHFFSFESEREKREERAVSVLSFFP